jgi:hypothetical protein
VAFALGELARLALERGEHERSRALASEALELHRRHEHEPGIAAAQATLEALAIH